ncbi:amino acid ABC transporter permease protein, His/Glu/Gln/Arg/opine family [Gottschalkia acidurici 9a]|uniref:Amino acid ABC transporter permease protein, His/Glu/Gln/Arg/opine family n=1 Tax=Gottschalkia acidurici (strain ATCC 7906 / DSM 604 / BCRC 14475 / CIP 104303 / KCTC 5404 / NCIMB 10678 / 9a) TaxID=1128398 RepID=K0AZB0_GOTA9|nr:amino acid ABC transporter permease [Gottschalkia acidurici]AFS77711.1 amino acid ABC transporter permease protein, His/Glu/Gln/Arg/opine family [Gottschalkia acidurici 9a]
MVDILNTTKYILGGLGVTISLSLVTLFLSIPLGMLSAIGKISSPYIIRKILNFYTWIFRGTPLLLQVLFVYYGLPIIHPSLAMSEFQAASLTFTLNYAAYLTEVFRAGIESIDDGQYDAAKALGFNYKETMKYIIIPQTIRRVIPPTCNEGVNLIKDTALVAVIGMGDLSRAAKEVVSREFNITPFIIAGIIYLIMTSLIMYVFRKLEDRYSIYM